MPRSLRAHSTFAAALFLAPLLALDPTEALAQGNMTVSTVLPPPPTSGSFSDFLYYQLLLLSPNELQGERGQSLRRDIALLEEIERARLEEEALEELEYAALAKERAAEEKKERKEREKQRQKMYEELLKAKSDLENKIDELKHSSSNKYKRKLKEGKKLLKEVEKELKRLEKDMKKEGQKAKAPKKSAGLPTDAYGMGTYILSPFGVEPSQQPISTSIALDENKMISLNGYTGRTRADPTATSSGVKADTDGLSLLYMVTDDLGADKKRYWGLNGGVGEGKVTSLSSPDVTSIDSWNVAALGGLQWQDGAYMSTSVGYSENRSKSQRFTTDGGLPAVALGTFTGRDTSGSLELGKTYRLGKRADEKDGEGKTASARQSRRAFWELAPQMSLQLRHFEQDAFTETGAGASSLDIGVIQVDTFQTSVGARLSRPTPTSNGGMFIPQLTLRYARELGDTHANIVSSFVGTSTTLVSESPRVSRDSLQVDAGVTLSTRDSWDLSASYVGQFASNYDNQTATATVSYRFD